jgi:LPS sulfotransferase NodH
MAELQPAPVAGICIIGMRRTGSNHLMNVLRNFRGLEATGELFNRDDVFGIGQLLPQLREITGLPIPRLGDQLIKAYARGNPGGFLAAVEEAVRRKGKRAYCFKVFEDQLSREALETQVLSRPGMRPVLLVRRALDSYISLEKAKSTDDWVGRDTTRSPITLDADAFAQWLYEQRAWYGHWTAWAGARGETPVVLTYEQDIDRPTCLVLWRFSRLAKRLGVPLQMPLRLRLRHRGLERQDRNRALSDRVANWPEFAAGLERLGLSEAARGYPL